MSKYKDLLKEMVDKNSEIFSSFVKAYENISDSDSRKAFNKIGDQVNELLIQYVNELCRSVDGSKFSKYGSRLEDQFRNYARSIYPMIDEIGVE
jgi:DnaJ-class molecular chaperone